MLYELEFEHRCPTLFEASNTDAISFTDAQQSFVALPTLPGKKMSVSNDHYRPVPT